MPQSSARRLAWTGAARAVGRRWRSYAALAGLALVASVIVATVPQLSLHEGYAGVALAALAGLVALSLIALPTPARDGHLAERWRVQAVRSARGWYLTEDLPFEGRHVDHIVIAPSAVLAVESVFRGPWSAAAGEPTEQHARDLAAADRAAQQVRLVLRAGEHGQSAGYSSGVAAVEPVLVVHGPGSPKLPTGYRFENGVHVVDGDHPERWMHVFGAPRLAEAARRDLHTAFQQFAAARMHDGVAPLPSLRVQLWRELRGGVADERAQRSRRHVQVVPAPDIATHGGDAPHALIA